MIGKSARVAEGVTIGRNCRVDPEVTEAMWTSDLRDGGFMASPPESSPSHGYETEPAPQVSKS